MASSKSKIPVGYALFGDGKPYRVHRIRGIQNRPFHGNFIPDSPNELWVLVFWTKGQGLPKSSWIPATSIDLKRRKNRNMLEFFIYDAAQHVPSYFDDSQLVAEFREWLSVYGVDVDRLVKLGRHAYSTKIAIELIGPRRRP